MRALARLSIGQWALILALISGVLLWVISLPPDHGTINVSRDDYEGALSKWRSQRVTAYEIVVKYTTKSCGIGPVNTCGTWTLRVEGDKVTIVEYARGNGPTETQATGEDVRFLTVDSLFEEVRETIEAGPFEYMGFPLDYVINFDDGKGYPRDIRRDGRQRNDGNINSMAWHLGSYIKVLDLRVISTSDD